MMLQLLLTLLTGLVLGLAFGAGLGVLWARARGASMLLDARVEQGIDAGEVLHGLDRISDQLHDLDRARVGWEQQLAQQVVDVRRSTEALGQEARTLSSALRKPQVRGRWGELHLRRAVELAGLVDRCDFTEQPAVSTDAGLQRPDLVVHLAGGRDVVVDSKVPLDAYLDAMAADEGDARAGHLARHARQLRKHVDGLAGKAYWRSLPASPEFVVLFVPAESFLAAALEHDPSLIEYAAERQVVLATPTTLIALLRTVAHGWRQQAVADEAREVHRLGRELHDRLTVLGRHLDGVGRSLNAAVGSYNAAMGSLDTRVLVTARRFRDLAVTDADLPAPRPVELSAVRRAVPTSEVDDPNVAG